MRTTAAYGNERQVGEAIAASDRSDVFIETKIWISDYGYDEALHGFEKSARKRGVDFHRETHFSTANELPPLRAG